MALNKIKTLSPWSKRSAAIGSIALLLAACGDNVTEVTEVTQVVGMQVVEKGDDLPKCTTEKEGQMVYSVDSAAAYYCINRKWTSMKGEDGKDGKNGTNGKNGSDGASCTAVEIDDGYKIVCGGDSVGVVLNGAKGDKGENGEKGTNGTNGEKGSDGASCTAVAIDGGYKIVCGDDSVGVVLNGTNGTNGINGVDGKNCEIVSDTNGVITLGCGDDTTTLYKALCNLTPYDPMEQYCSLQGIFDLKKCGDNLYNPESHFCDTRNYKTYRYVTIAPEGTDYSEVWMAENLNYKVESSVCYKNEEIYCTRYGRLYTWATAVGTSEEDCGLGNTCRPSGRVRGVCPEGWHLPDNSEWKSLIAIFGELLSASSTGVGAYWNDTAGVALKATRGWSGDGNGSDYFGFSALPAGRRGCGTSSDYTFCYEREYADFWSSSESGSDRAFHMYLYYDDDRALLGNTGYKDYAYSVRCIKD